MREVLFPVIALLVGSAPALAEPEPLFCDVGVVKVEEDRFHGTAGAMTSPMLKLDSMNPALAWSSSMDGRLALILTGSFKSWRYLDCHPIGILADGQRLEIKNTPEHDGKVTQGGVIEQLVVHLSWEARNQLRKARKLEYKICNDEYVAPDAFLCSARDLIRAVEEWKKVQGASPGTKQ